MTLSKETMAGCNGEDSEAVSSITSDESSKEDRESEKKDFGLEGESLSISTVRVNLSLCKTEGSNRVLEEEHAAIRASIEETPMRCQHLINQRLLLEDLHDSKVASPYLLQPVAAPVGGGGRLLGKQVKEDTRDRDKVDGTKEAGDGSSAQQTGSIPAGSAQSSTNSSVSSSPSGADGNSSVGSAANLSNKESHKPVPSGKLGNNWRARGLALAPRLSVRSKREKELNLRARGLSRQGSRRRKRKKRRK